jgi:multidrug resistance efflux pump
LRAIDPADLSRQLAEALTAIETLRAEVARLTAENQELRARLARDSSHSSRCLLRPARAHMGDPPALINGAHEALLF